MRAMIAANDDRPSCVARHLDEQQGWADDKAANDRDQDRASGARPHDNHQIEEQSEKRDKYIHRLQPRFPRRTGCVGSAMHCGSQHVPAVRRIEDRHPAERSSGAVVEVYKDRVEDCANEKQERDAHLFPLILSEAIQPVRLGRGEVARIPELMRILDLRTAKK